MYRDDHEAALARVQALETELAMRATDARKLATLTREAAEARAKLERLEGELRQIRPRPAARAPVASPPGLVLLLVGFGGLGGLAVLGALAHRRSEAPVEASPAPAPTQVAAAQVLADGIRRATELAPGAELVAVQATGVQGDGKLHPIYGELAVELVRDNGPEPALPVDPARPIGAPSPEHNYLRYDCIRFVYARGRWEDQYPAIRMDIERVHSCFDDFTKHPPLHPRCSITTIVQRAASGAVHAVAGVTLDASGWTFAIDDPALHVNRHYLDDC